jgi:ABC-type transport system involved in cytochrome bd biosynthesis fused ATPase/permease subunit
MVAQTTEFVSSDEAGLATRVAERGANWSGGQRARIALARGVLAAAGSALVLLDEPTASLDARTEAGVYDSVFAAFPDACIVSSVHRMNLLERFDEVILMRAGQIVAQGSVAALNAGSTDFQQLMNAYRRAAQAE